MTCRGLRQFVRIFPGLVGRCIGQDSLLCKNRTEVGDHIDNNKLDYTYEFRNDPPFRGEFAGEDNWQVHKFLGYCTIGEVEKILTRKLDFSIISKQIESRNYNKSTGVDLSDYQEKRVPELPTSDLQESNKRGGGNGGRKSHQFTPQEQ